MRNNPKGGMHTTGLSYNIYCPLCGKPAATKAIKDDKEIYMHFTKSGVNYHVKYAGGKWIRKRKID